MVDVKYCDKCLAKHVEKICPTCKGKGLPKEEKKTRK